MRNVLAVLFALIVSPVLAADNAVILTPGSGVTMRTQDVGGGVQSPYNILGSTSGASIYGTAGTANANILTVQGIASMTPLLSTVTNAGTFATQATQAGTWTVQPGNTANTTAWLVTGTGGTFPISGTSASGAALAGNPVRVGLSDGTNAQNWLTAIALADGVNGNNTGAVAGWVWNGTTWDRMPGTTAGVTVRSPTAANFLVTLPAETTKVIGTVRHVGNVGGVFDAVAGAAVPANSLQIGMAQGGNLVTMTGTSGNLNVQCANCSGSGVSTADEATFTAGTSLFAGTGGFFQTTATANALTNGQQGMWQMTANRAGFVNFRNAAGTEIGTSAAEVFVGGRGTAGTAGGGVLTVQGVASMTKLLVTPDSVALPANQSVNVSQINSVTPLMGNGATGTGAQRVTIANDNTLPAGWASSVAIASTTAGQTGPLAQCAVTTASPTYTTAQTDPLSCDTAGSLRVAIVSGGGSGGTSSTFGAAFPATGTAIGVSDGTNMIALRSGTAGTAAPTVLTVQGVASMTKLLVTPDSVALPANQSVNVSQINGVTTLMGNGVTGTGSQRVTIASDNTAFSVNATLSAETTKVIGTINLSAAQTLATVTTVGTVTNLAQMNGAALLMGNGVTGTGSQRVTIASDNTAFTVNPASATAPVSTMNSASANSGVNSAMAAVFDDTTPTAITENSFGFVRMSANRNQYHTIRDSAGNERGANVNASNQLSVSCDNGCSASTSITSWGGGTLGAMATYGTSPGAVLVPGVNAFITNVNANGQATMSNSSPVTIASNQSNLTVIGAGTAGTANSGVVTVQGIASMTKLLVTPDSVALPANQSVNVSQINGVTPLMGNGTTGTGSPRVTIASDGTAISTAGYMSVKVDQTTDGTTNYVKTGTRIATLTTGITRPADTAAYAANDNLSNSTSAPTAGGFTFTSACAVSGGNGLIKDAIVSASAGTLYQGEIWIFDQAVTAVNDNAAFTVSDADVLNLVGVIPFATTNVTAANSISYVTNIDVGYTCVGTANLRYLVKIMSAVTPGNAEVLTVRLKVQT